MKEKENLNVSGVYKNYIDSHAKHKEAKKAAFRIVYSGNRSYHFWFYVENEITSREQYKAVHKYLNDTFFGGIADDAINTPEHYVRAPGVIREETVKSNLETAFELGTLANIALTSGNVEAVIG